MGDSGGPCGTTGANGGQRGPTGANGGQRGPTGRGPTGNGFGTWTCAHWPGHHGGQWMPTGANGGQRGPTGAKGTGANGQRIWDLDTHTPDLEEIYRTLTDKLFREQCVYCGFDHFRIANIGLKCLPKTVPEKVFSSNSWCEMCAQCELNLSKQNYFPFSFIELWWIPT